MARSHAARRRHKAQQTQATALAKALSEWVYQNGTQAEQHAYWRRAYASAGHLGSVPTWRWLQMCGGQLKPQPGDDELLRQLDARLPDELRAQMSALAAAVKGAEV